MAFNRDMIFHHAVQTNWDTIHQERQKLVAASNQKENQSCLMKQYSPGDKVLITFDSDERRSQPKMTAPTWNLTPSLEFMPMVPLKSVA